MKSKRFRDLSRTGKLWALISIGASLALVAAAERDIHRHASAELNGSKAMWRLVGSLP